MTFNDFCTGDWLEYSGGSRPRSRMVRFERREDGSLALDLFYVFDWETGERQDLSYLINPEQARSFIKDVDTVESALVQVHGPGEQEFTLECRLPGECGTLEFRLKGRPLMSDPSPCQFDMSGFASVTAPLSSRGGND